MGGATPKSCHEAQRAQASCRDGCTDCAAAEHMRVMHYVKAEHALVSDLALVFLLHHANQPTACIILQA